jgi:two-component system CheB/CheR fusion protein
LDLSRRRASAVAAGALPLAAAALAAFAAAAPGGAVTRALCAALAAAAALAAWAAARHHARREQAGVRTAEARLRQLLDSLPEVVWSARADGAVEFLSERFYELTGCARELAAEAAWAQALAPGEPESARAAYEQAIGAGQRFELELRLRDRGGGTRWFLCRAEPRRDGEGVLTGWSGSCTDIDGRKRTETGLREADRRKDQFLAALGHELRNPLAAIRNGLQILQTKAASPEQTADARRVIERQVENVARLVDDLLDVNRLVAGRIALRTGELDLREPLRAAVELRRAAARQRRQTLSVELPPEPLRVRGDRGRLEQVFVNLLGNALKYSEPGSSVRVVLERDGESAVARFRDEGIGIASADLQRVFEPFVQLDPERARADGGLGIGLTLVRHLVELHGGRVAATSAGVGRGSEFSVRLPALPPPPDAAGDGALYRSRARAAGQRILVVDDNADSAQSLSTLLSILGNEVCTAADGLEGLEVAERFHPEVVLLDLGMPRMDGYEAARRLRTQPWARDVMLVALTGWSQDEDRARSREAGFDHHLVKPVDPHLLDELLQARSRAAVQGFREGL